MSEIMEEEDKSFSGAFFLFFPGVKGVVDNDGFDRNDG